MAFSLTARSNTPIDPVASIGADGSSFTVDIVLPGLTSTVGTLDASQLTLRVTDPGYDRQGNVTLVTRTITGVDFVRRQFPNGNTRLITTSGGDLNLTIAVDDRIYSGTTIVSAAITSTFYTGCTAGPATSITNSSTKAYPKPGFTFAQPPLERATGTFFDVEGCASHRHARNGQQVPCIKYSMTDGTNTTPDYISGEPLLSTRILQGYPPEVYPARILLAPLTQGVVCSVNAKVYPWIGDSTAVLNVAVDGATWPSAVPITPLQVLNDKTGAYGECFAYVKIGAVGGTTSATAATARAAPYPTIADALFGVQAFNNASKSHNDIGAGRVRVMDTNGTAALHDIGGDGPYAPGLSWCYVERDPLATAPVRVTWGGLYQMSSKIAWGGNGLIMAPQAGVFGLCGNFSSDECQMLHNLVLENVGDRLLLQDRKFVLNVLTVGGLPLDLSNFAGSSTANLHFMAGLVSNTQNSPVMVAQTMLGNIVPQCNWGLVDGEGSNATFAQNNRMLAANANSGSSLTLAFGPFMLQNVFEQDGATGNNCMNMFADGDMTTYSNYVEMHTTAMGDRCSHHYNDTTAAKIIPNGLVKEGVMMFNNWDNYNIKTDTFPTAVGDGSVGNWGFCYSCGCLGNVSNNGQVGRGQADAPHNDNTDVPYMGMAWLSGSDYNLYRTAYGLTPNDIMNFYEDYRVAPKAVPRLGGTYRPLPTSTRLRNRVPAGRAVLKYDIEGRRRKNDGTGAAGAYEIYDAPAAYSFSNESYF